VLVASRAVLLWWVEYIPYSETPIMVSLGNSGFEHGTEENLKWRKFHTKITDLRPLKLDCKVTVNLKSGTICHI
jgi:hypothetical protein